MSNFYLGDNAKVEASDRFVKVSTVFVQSSVPDVYDNHVPSMAILKFS